MGRIEQPLNRIIEKLDSYLHSNDYNGAERHLKYWLEESGMARDDRAELMLLNELMGLYRNDDLLAPLGRANLGTIEKGIADLVALSDVSTANADKIMPCIVEFYVDDRGGVIVAVLKEIGLSRHISGGRACFVELFRLQAVIQDARKKLYVRFSVKACGKTAHHLRVDELFGFY